MLREMQSNSDQYFMVVNPGGFLVSCDPYRPVSAGRATECGPAAFVTHIVATVSQQLVILRLINGEIPRD